MSVPLSDRADSLELGAMERALDRASGARALEGNAIRLLTDGPVTFDATEAAILQARHCVHFENYIIRDDRTGHRFADLLGATARRGVIVRLLYDAHGSSRTGAAYWRKLRRAGVQVRAFNPLNPFRPWHFLTRDHRKYVGVDGVMGIVGGHCVGDEWAGNPAKRRLPWRDTAVEVRGPAATALELGFARMWERTGQPIPESELTADPKPQGSATVRVIEGVPGSLRVHRTIALLATGVAERLWITEAYLLPPQTIYAALRAAARDQVDVRLLVPGRSDVPALTVFSRTGYRRLLAAGARIWEWRGPMLHAKTVVMDDRWFKVGSSNLNDSSLRGNFEVDLLIEDETITQAAAQQFRLDLSRSVEVVPRRPKWAPDGILARVPPALVLAQAQHPLDDHLPSAGERSRHAVVTLRQVLSGARRSIVGATVFGVIGAGALLLTLPRVMAYLLAFACFWLGGSAAWRFFEANRPTDD
jgi:cardiolipin synthase